MFPNRIRNERLYERTGAVPLGMINLRAGWRLFGHVLRLPADSPPPLAMGVYLAEPSPAGWRGRPRHTPVQRAGGDDQDIRYKCYYKMMPSGLDFPCQALEVDLEAFRALAADGSGVRGGHLCARGISTLVFIFFSHMSSFFLYLFWTFVSIQSGLCEHFCWFA